MEKTMKKAQTQRLEALAPTKGANQQTFWKKIGVAFPLKNKVGYSLKLEFMPAPTEGAFEIVLVAPKPKSEEKA